MRVFAISDLHIDFEENRRWLYGLSQHDYQDDLLIVAGDITDQFSLLAESFTMLKKRFRDIFYTLGNHDLWVHRNQARDSFEHFHRIKQLAENCQIRMESAHFEALSIVPLYGWYDYSFGSPSDELLTLWRDFTACKWPDGFDAARITQYFLALNETVLPKNRQTIISFSHFLPRIDLLPFPLSSAREKLLPIFGSSLLEQQIRRIGSHIHIYGHHHLNRRISRDNTLYINNAFGYPHETYMTAKELVCVFES